MSQSDSTGQTARSAVVQVEAPPTSVLGILKRLGPGLIIAGSIVGSGELIATTATGAKAGFWLLWLIVIGCVIKVFVQVELGRFTIAHGRTTMDGMNSVPGPVIAVWWKRSEGPPSLCGNWFLWYWLFVFLASLGQLGGIVGGVGQALAISLPITEEGRLFNRQLDWETQYRIALAELAHARSRAAAGDRQAQQRIASLEERVAQLGPQIIDDRLLWADEEARRLAERNDPAAKARAEKLSQARAVVEQRRRQLGDRPELVFAVDVDDASGLDEQLVDAIKNLGRRSAADHQYWATIVTVVTAVILVLGRYGFIQTFSTILVASFTLITILNVFALQSHDTYAVTWRELFQGMSFRLSPRSEMPGMSPLITALATFGIIGVGGNELVSYPYWCLEKGYARFTGPREETAEWAARARGWLRVMRWDAWCSMAVYTFATIAFYLLGAAILHKIQLFPEGTEMIRTLSVMYEPVFGASAQVLFLFGAFAVLYSTFFVATASHARVFPDVMRTFGVGRQDESFYRGQVRLLSGLLPFISLSFYIAIPQPTMLVLLSGTMQAIMLPMLSAGALYFRYRLCDPRIKPGPVWDLLLWISALGMLVAGVWLALNQLFPSLQRLA